MPRAGVCTGLHQRLEILDLRLDEPRRGEIRVEMKAAGLCGTDLSVLHGKLPSPLPLVLGHQGVGVVTAVGDEVSSMEVGDHVVVAPMPQCGACYRCQRGEPSLCELSENVMASGALADGTPRFSRPDGSAVFQLTAAGTFAEEVVVAAASAARIPRELPFVPAGIIGCGVLTGFATTQNLATIRPDSTVVVIGCGTVGLSAIQGARLAGAAEIVAIDLLPEKVDLACSLGATEGIKAAGTDVVAAVRDLTGGRGAHVAVECVGLQATIDQAIRMTGRGGEVLFVGAGDHDTRVNVRQFGGLVNSAKTLKGVMFGAADIRRDVMRIAEHYQAGNLELDRLVTRTFTLDEINDGIAELESGQLVTGVVDLQ